MDTTQSDGPRARRLERTGHDGVALDRKVTARELARLESAHDQLLRQVQDLKRVYAAERERRARLARSTMDLVTVLARHGASSTFSPLGAADSEAAGGV